MPLTPEQIEKLLIVASQPKSRGRKPKGFIDTSTRDYQTWFKLGAKLVDEETGEFAKCDNPDCTDTRGKETGKAQLVVVIDEKKICRICFMDGWLNGSI